MKAAAYEWTTSAPVTVTGMGADGVRVVRKLAERRLRRFGTPIPEAADLARALAASINDAGEVIQANGPRGPASVVITRLALPEGERSYVVALDYPDEADPAALLRALAADNRVTHGNPVYVTVTPEEGRHPWCAARTMTIFVRRQVRAGRAPARRSRTAADVEFARRMIVKGMRHARRQLHARGFGPVRLARAADETLSQVLHRDGVLILARQGPLLAACAFGRINRDHDWSANAVAELFDVNWATRRPAAGLVANLIAAFEGVARARRAVWLEGNVVPDRGDPELAAGILERLHSSGWREHRYLLRLEPDLTD